MYSFYRAMHFSAKRGIAIACRLSVCLSVCNVGGLWSLQPQHDGSATRGTPLNLGPKWHTPVDLSVGDIRSQIAAEWLQIAQRSQWRAYRKLPLLFLMVPFLTPYDLPFPQNKGSICPQHTRMAISLQRVIRSTSFWFQGRVFGDGGSNGAIYGSNKSKLVATAMLEKFQVAISPQPVVRSTSCLVIGWGFRRRRV